MTPVLTNAHRLQVVLSLFKHHPEAQSGYIGRDLPGCGVLYESAASLNMYIVVGADMLPDDCSGVVDFEFWRPINNEVDQAFAGRLSWRWNTPAEAFEGSCIIKAPHRPQMMLDPVPKPDIPDWAVACSWRNVSDGTGSMSSWPCWIARRTDLLFIQLIEEESSRRTVGSLDNVRVRKATAYTIEITPTSPPAVDEPTRNG